MTLCVPDGVHNFVKPRVDLRHNWSLHCLIETFVVLFFWLNTSTRFPVFLLSYRTTVSCSWAVADSGSVFCFVVNVVWKVVVVGGSASVYKFQIFYFSEACKRLWDFCFATVRSLHCFCSEPTPRVLFCFRTLLFCFGTNVAVFFWNGFVFGSLVMRNIKNTMFASSVFTCFRWRAILLSAFWRESPRFAELFQRQQISQPRLLEFVESATERYFGLGGFRTKLRTLGCEFSLPGRRECLQNNPS